jgi:hypothetical protein
MRNFLLIVCLALCIPFYGQIYVDKPLILNGSSAQDKQIVNLTNPENSDDITPASVIQQNSGRYGLAVGADSLKISIPSGIHAYTSGNIIYFKATEFNTGSVQVSVNNLPFFPLRIYPMVELSSHQLKPGQIYCIVFSGAAFQILSEINNGCRPNFVESNSNSCIEIDERPAAELWDAMRICNENNSRLCKWGEWYYACQKAGLGLKNMANNNWEWTDDAANYSVRVAGNGFCSNLQVSNISSTILRPYRCCYSK